MKLQDRLARLETAGLTQRIPIADHDAVERLARSKVAGGCSEAEWTAALIAAQEELHTSIVVRSAADWNL